MGQTGKGVLVATVIHQQPAPAAVPSTFVVKVQLVADVQGLIRWDLQSFQGDFKDARIGLHDTGLVGCQDEIELAGKAGGETLARPGC